MQRWEEHEFLGDGVTVKRFVGAVVEKQTKKLLCRLWPPAVASDVPIQCCRVVIGVLYFKITMFANEKRNCS